MCIKIVWWSMLYFLLLNLIKWCVHEKKWWWWWKKMCQVFQGVICRHIHFLNQQIDGATNPWPFRSVGVQVLYTLFCSIVRSLVLSHFTIMYIMYTFYWKPIHRLLVGHIYAYIRICTYHGKNSTFVDRFTHIKNGI